jgi:hypothetical protein
MRVVKRGDEFQNGRSGGTPSVVLKRVRKRLKEKEMRVARCVGESVSD